MVPSARLHLMLVLAGACLGCSAQTKGSTTHIGETRDQDIPEQTDAEAPPPTEDKPPPPEDIIVHHAAPISGYRTVDDRSFERESLFTHLADADVICIGERHDDPSDHYAQLQLVNALLERREIRGFQLGLGMEMVRRYNQPALSDFIDGKISEDELEERTAWKKDWGFPIQYYRPQMREILVQGGELIALGVPQDITRKVATEGLSGLDDNDRRVLPELDTEDRLHRELFDLMMQQHPGLSADDLDHYYLAQVIWDESMADRATAWVKQQLPGRKLVIFAGAAHCHPHAIPARIQRRAPVRAVSVLPAKKSELPTQATGNRAPPRPPEETPQDLPGTPAQPVQLEGSNQFEGMAPREALLSGYDYLLLRDD